MALLVGHGVVARALRYDEGVALAQLDGTPFHLDPQPALQDDEELVLVLVGVPGERALDLRDLHVRIVELGDDARRPQLGQRVRGRPQGHDAGHAAPPGRVRRVSVAPMYSYRPPMRNGLRGTGVAAVSPSRMR